jgi:hypothetical protein
MSMASLTATNFANEINRFLAKGASQAKQAVLWLSRSVIKITEETAAHGRPLLKRIAQAAQRFFTQLVTFLKTPTGQGLATLSIGFVAAKALLTLADSNAYRERPFIKRALQASAIVVAMCAGALWLAAIKA